MTTLVSELPVAALKDRLGLPEREAGNLVEALRRLGIGTLGALAALSPDQVADRFGPLGLHALRLARGEDEPLRPRTPHEELVEEIELPEGTAGSQLERALELLVDRLLAAPQRKGRTLLGLRLGALLSGGGSWSVEQGLGRPTASARALRAAAGAAAGGAAGPGRGAAPAGARPRPAGRRPARALGRRRGAAPAPPRRRGARGPRRPGRRGAAQDPPGRLRLARARALGDADALPGEPDDPRAAAPLRAAAGARSRPTPAGAPLAVDGVAVEAVREEWLVEDRWWTPRPLRRHYFELALADGRAAGRLPQRGERALVPAAGLMAAARLHT